jgi:hypothetical protein
MGPTPAAERARPLTKLEREIRDHATSHCGEFTLVMAANGAVWLIDGFGRTNVADAVKALVIKGIAEPVGLPKPTGAAPGEVRQSFRLL